MSSRTITAIAFKLFSIYLVVQVLFAIPGVVAMLHQLEIWSSNSFPDSYLPFYISGAILAVGVFYSFVIWRLGQSVLLSTPDVDQVKVQNVESVLFQMLGIILIISSLRYLPLNVIKVFFDNLYNPDQYLLQGEQFAVLINFGVLVMGAHMLLRPTGWKLLLQKFRAVGQSNP